MFLESLDLSERDADDALCYVSKHTQNPDGDGRGGRRRMDSDLVDGCESIDATCCMFT